MPWIRCDEEVSNGMVLNMTDFVLYLSLYYFLIFYCSLVLGSNNIEVHVELGQLCKCLKVCYFKLFVISKIIALLCKPLKRSLVASLCIELWASMFCEFSWAVQKKKVQYKCYLCIKIINIGFRYIFCDAGMPLRQS